MDKKQTILTQETNLLNKLEDLLQKVAKDVGRAAVAPEIDQLLCEGLFTLEIFI